ncbi:MAG: hypothetical protein AAFO84_01000 [Cyanobacteria bacterium J06598_1]
MNLSNLPGGDLILPGVEALERGETDAVGALLIAIASTRLSNAGLMFPRDNLAKDPELTLYARLKTERTDPYPYYNALLDSLNSFCNALEQRKWYENNKE